MFFSQHGKIYFAICLQKSARRPSYTRPQPIIPAKTRRPKQTVNPNKQLFTNKQIPIGKMNQNDYKKNCPQKLHPPTSAIFFLLLR